MSLERRRTIPVDDAWDTVFNYAGVDIAHPHQHVESPLDCITDSKELIEVFYDSEAATALRSLLLLSGIGHRDGTSHYSQKVFREYARPGMPGTEANPYATSPEAARLEIRRYTARYIPDDDSFLGQSEYVDRTKEVPEVVYDFHIGHDFFDMKQTTSPATYHLQRLLGDVGMDLALSLGGS